MKKINCTSKQFIGSLLLQHRNTVFKPGSGPQLVSKWSISGVNNRSWVGGVWGIVRKIVYKTSEQDHVNLLICLVATVTRTVTEKKDMIKMNAYDYIAKVGLFILYYYPLSNLISTFESFH